MASEQKFVVVQLNERIYKTLISLHEYGHNTMAALINLQASYLRDPLNHDCPPSEKQQERISWSVELINDLLLDLLQKEKDDLKLMPTSKTATE